MCHTQAGQGAVFFAICRGKVSEGLEEALLDTFVLGVGNPFSHPNLFQQSFEPFRRVEPSLFYNKIAKIVKNSNDCLWSSLICLKSTSSKTRFERTIQGNLSKAHASGMSTAIWEAGARNKERNLLSTNRR